MSYDEPKITTSDGQTVSADSVKTTTLTPQATPTREEREELNALSKIAYGPSSKWQSVMRKGELRPAKDTTAAGEPIEVKRLHYFTITEIKAKMEQIIKEREEAQKVAEAAQKEDEAKNELAKEPVQQNQS